MRKVGMAAICSWITVAVALRTFAAEPENKAVNSPAKVKVTIGKETTYITEPLRADGYPDYVAALNERLSKGVTPENNAVLLVQALGPEIIPKATREETFKRLGIDQLPAKGDYIISQAEMIKRWRANHADANQVTDDELFVQFEQAAKYPWSAKQFPIVTEWLAINEKPLELARKGIERPKYYFPALPDGDLPPVISILLPLAQESRQLADLLAIRAMQRAAQGNVEGAWDDLLTCHRLARHMTEGFSLVEALVGIAIEHIAAQGDCALAHSGTLNVKQATQMRAELHALPTLVNIVDKVDLGERFMFLDAAAFVARDGGFRGLLKITDLQTSLA
jgi:hypothetical protein